jgi:hypothetical protein
MNRKHYATVAFISPALIVLGLIFLTGCGSTNYTNQPEVLAVTSGAPQSATVTTAFAAPLVGTVTMGGAPVSGAVVTFTAPTTGATGTFAGGVSTVTVTASSSGVATSPVFTANTTAGAYSVTATVSGVIGSTSFNLTNSAGPPASIVASGGTPQTATISTAFGQLLVATVKDSYQNLVSGAVVTFTAPATGQSGTFPSGVITTTATTDANGLATSPVFTANAKAGTYKVTATVPGVATTVNFKLTNIKGAVQTIVTTSGTPQSATVNTAFAAPLVATVTSGGTPVSGALVTFTAPVAADASGTFAGGVNTATTDANGVATSTTFTANSTVGTYTVTATVTDGAAPADFILTNTGINYAFYLSGLESVNDGPNFYAVAGAVTVDGSGKVVGGEQDYNDAFGFASSEPSGDTIMGGKLTMNGTPGQGTITLKTNNANLGVNGTETLGVQFVNASHALIVQFDGSATSSGSMDLQTLSGTLGGGYAFTVSGVDSAYDPVVFGGVFSISGTTLQNGIVDVDDDGDVTLNTPFTGTISSPDAFGRGTITGTGIAITLNYYIVGPEAIRIIDVDADDSGFGSAYGQGAGSFSNSSLGSSAFGVQSNSYGTPFAAAGQFAVPTSGTFQGVADDNELGSVIVPSATISGSYSISGNGYGSLTIPSGDLGDVSALGIYMTDPNLNLNDPNNTTSGLGGALVADLDLSLNGTGVLIPQTDTSTADFTGNYAFGAQEYFDFYYGFDFVGQGPVADLALSGTGLVSDPFEFFSGDTKDSGVTFSGTASPDGANAGRYTFPLAITVAGSENDFQVVIYQASGGQLFWLDEDSGSVFLGLLQQQGSLTGLPAAKRVLAKPRLNRPRS